MTGGGAGSPGVGQGQILPCSVETCAPLPARQHNSLHPLPTALYRLPCAASPLLQSGGFTPDMLTGLDPQELLGGFGTGGESSAVRCSALPVHHLHFLAA